MVNPERVQKDCLYREQHSKTAEITDNGSDVSSKGLTPCSWRRCRVWHFFGKIFRFIWCSTS